MGQTGAMRIEQQYGWPLNFPTKICCSTIGSGYFLITKKVMITLIYLSISLESTIIIYVYFIYALYILTIQCDAIRWNSFKIDTFQGAITSDPIISY